MASTRYSTTPTGMRPKARMRASCVSSTTPAPVSAIFTPANVAADPATSGAISGSTPRAPRPTSSSVRNESPQENSTMSRAIASHCAWCQSTALRARSLTRRGARRRGRKLPCTSARSPCWRRSLRRRSARAQCCPRGCCSCEGRYTRVLSLRCKPRAVRSIVAARRAPRRRRAPSWYEKLPPRCAAYLMRAMSSSGAVPQLPAVHADGLPVPRRYWAMAAIALAIAMSVLDSSIANVALPTIARDFGATPAASIWVINAYQLAILVLLLPLASLGEIVGYRRVAQTGLAVFTLASLACAFAPTLAALSIARIVQGFGAAGIMSVGPALVRFTYPHRYLGRAIGINAFVIATSAALGPTIAAAVLAVAHWRWLFGINVPLGLITICIALASLPETERTARPLNYAGAALCAGAFGLLVSGLQSFAHQGSRVLALSLLTSVCAFMAQTAALVALPFEIQRLGHSAVTTGLLMTPWPLALAVAAPLAGHLTDRYAAGALGACGLLLLAAGLALLALLPAHAAEGSVVWRMMLCGLGFGFFQAPNNRTILASAPRQRSGAAGGLLGVGRLLGQALGAAAVAILFGIYAAAGSNIALWAGALLALAGAAFSAGRLSRGNEAHA